MLEQFASRYSNGSSSGLESWIFAHMASWHLALVLISPQEPSLNSRIQSSGELQRFVCWPVMPDITREFTEVSVLPILNTGLLRAGFTLIHSHHRVLLSLSFSVPFSLCYSSKQTIPNSDREETCDQFRSLQADAPSYPLAPTSASPSLLPYQPNIR